MPINNNYYRDRIFTTMTSQAIKLIKYDHWANAKVYTAMSQVEVLPPRAIELFSHILAVSSIWLSRAKGESEIAKRFDLYTLKECETLNSTMLSKWLDYINSLANIDEKRMTFSLLGQRSEIEVLDCINHVVMHGSYHRGQIVALLKGHLPELPLTDFVLFASAKT